jgi:hypothetical protein
MRQASRREHVRGARFFFFVRAARGQLREMRGYENKHGQRRHNEEHRSQTDLGSPHRRNLCFRSARCGRLCRLRGLVYKEKEKGSADVCHFVVLLSLEIVYIETCQGQLCTCTVEPRIREKICDRRDLRVSRSRRRFVRQSAGCRRQELPRCSKEVFDRFLYKSPPSSATLGSELMAIEEPRADRTSISSPSRLLEPSLTPFQVAGQRVGRATEVSLSCDCPCERKRW